MTVVVNGRFLRAQPTGLHRTARSFLDAAVAAGLQAEVLAPVGVEDPRVDRHPWAPRGRFADHLWEQGRLPAAAGRRLVLSLTNTSPVLARRSAVMVHDLTPLVGPEWFAGSMQLYGRLVLAGARRAQTVLTVSDAAARDLVEHGVPQDRISVVRPVVDPSFAPAPQEDVDAVRQRLRLDRPYALVVGWADPRKDAATAVAAHLQVAARVPHDLVLVGREHVTFAPVSLPEASSVRRAGYLTDPELRALLTGAAVLLYPSLYEGYGLPPLEAWACGTPAVVSDAAAVQEATQGRAVTVPVRDVDGWARALEAVLVDGIEVPQPASSRSWTDAGRELRAALG